MKLFKRPSFDCFKCKLKLTPSFSCFKFKNPCKTNLLQCFKYKLRLKRRISIRFRRNRRTRTTTISRRKNRIRGFLSLFRRKKRPQRAVRTTTHRKKNPLRELLSVFTRRRRGGSQRRRVSLTHNHHHSSSEEAVDEVGELRSVTGTGEREMKLFSSPLTPAYVKNSGLNYKREVHMGSENGDGGGDVEAACRSFESYLVEMIIEEGKMRDLTDVEELLYCWKNLKCPVFSGLVSRFYGELCKDMFLLGGDQQDQEDDDDNDSIHPCTSSC